MKSYVILFLFFFSSILGYSQKWDTIYLNRVVHPKLSFDKVIENNMGAGAEAQYSKLRAADCIDNNVKFTIAICHLSNNYSFIVAPYKTDTVFIGLGVHQTFCKIETPIVIEAEGSEYTAKISKYGDYIILSKLHGKHISPDVKLYTDQIPYINFSLLDGGTSSFSSYEHQNKYIYVEFWGTWCGGCMASLKDIGEVNKLYKDKLSIIFMDYMDVDMAHVKTVVQENNLDWVQGISNDTINREFLVNGYPYGVLFNSAGKVIERDLHPSLLKGVLENQIKKNGK